MKKDVKSKIQDFMLANNIDWRTVCIIVHHYLYLGEQVVESLTEEDVQEEYNKQVKYQQEVEKDGKTICMITPDFVKYLLDSCRAMYQLEPEIRYEFIKEYL